MVLKPLGEGTIAEVEHVDVGGILLGEDPVLSEVSEVLSEVEEMVEVDRVIEITMEIITRKMLKRGKEQILLIRVIRNQIIRSNPFRQWGAVSLASGRLGLPGRRTLG